MTEKLQQSEYLTIITNSSYNYLFYMVFILYDLHLHYRGLLTRGVAPPAACRIIDDEELFLLLLLLLSLTRRSGVGVYDMRRADPNESFDRALLLIKPFLED